MLSQDSLRVLIYCFTMVKHSLTELFMPVFNVPLSAKGGGNGSVAQMRRLIS